MAYEFIALVSKLLAFVSSQIRSRYLSLTTSACSRSQNILIRVYQLLAGHIASV
jgi:hypothetical protein